MAGRTPSPGILAAAGAFGALVLAAASCGGGSSSGPTEPPVTVVPTPAPTPPPDVRVDSSACPLGPGTVDASCSSRMGSSHLGAVQEAIDRVVQEWPGLFRLDEESPEGSGQYRVVDPEAYLDALVDELGARGFCAQRGYDRETVQVKDSNDLSEDFDVLLSSGHIRRNAYLTTCQPASFPVTPGDLIARVRVAFWGFDCNPGVVPPANIAGKLPLGCDGSVTATPKDQEDADIPLSIHGPEIEWELRRGGEVVEVLEDRRFPNPFNKVLRPLGPIHYFQLCATVQGVEGCLSGETIP